MTGKGTRLYAVVRTSLKGHYLIAVLCGRLTDALKQMNYPDAEEQVLSMLSEMVRGLSLACACTEPEQARQMLKVSRRYLKKRLEIVWKGIRSKNSNGHNSGFRDKQ